MPPATSPSSWYDHPYVKMLHTVLTALLTTALIAMVSSYMELRDQIAENRQQLAVVCSKIDLIYDVVVEGPLKNQGSQQP